MENTEITWTEMTPAYIDMLLDPHFPWEAKQNAVENIMRMAAALDACNGNAFNYSLSDKEEYILSFYDTEEE